MRSKLFGGFGVDGDRGGDEDGSRLSGGGRLKLSPASSLNLENWDKNELVKSLHKQIINIFIFPTISFIVS